MPHPSKNNWSKKNSVEADDKEKVEMKATRSSETSVDFERDSTALYFLNLLSNLLLPPCTNPHPTSYRYVFSQSTLTTQGRQVSDTHTHIT
jgi:hypothetical protein